MRKEYRDFQGLGALRSVLSSARRQVGHKVKGHVQGEVGHQGCPACTPDDFSLLPKVKRLQQIARIEIVRRLLKELDWHIGKRGRRTPNPYGEECI